MYQKCLQVLGRLPGAGEIIFVNDGSTDNTAGECSRLSPLVYIELRKNFGQTAAMDAGIKRARGRTIITMDGDLQNDPADIPAMLAYLEQNGLDVVSGWRKNRRDSLGKRFVSRAANLLRRLMINDGIHDSGCSLKVYRRECFEHVDLSGEMHRFIPALLKIKGFKIGEMAVTHHSRIHGKTKYNWQRTLKGFLDMFAVWFWKKFANRPIHLLGTLGIITWLIGVVSALYALYMKIFLQADLSDTAFTLLALLAFFFGLTFIFMGVILDVASKAYYFGGKDEIYSVKTIKEQ